MLDVLFKVPCTLAKRKSETGKLQTENHCDDQKFLFYIQGVYMLFKVPCTLEKKSVIHNFQTGNRCYDQKFLFCIKSVYMLFKVLCTLDKKVE
jgi:hypothetical protein